MKEIKDNMSYTYEGQLSTDKDDRNLGHILGHIYGFGLELKLIPAQTRNGIRINQLIVCVSCTELQIKQRGLV